MRPFGFYLSARFIRTAQTTSFLCLKLNLVLLLPIRLDDVLEALDSSKSGAVRFLFDLRCFYASVSLSVCRQSPLVIDTEL